MAKRGWALVALLAAAPAMAEVVRFQGHSIEVGVTDGARRVLSVQGAPYSIPGSTAQTIGKVQACLARADSGVGIVSVDPAGGRLRAISRSQYQQAGEARLLRSRWAVDATGGSFRITLSDLADIRGTGVDESYAPLSIADDSGWQEPLAAVMAVEKSLLDCMYR